MWSSSDVLDCRKMDQIKLETRAQELSLLYSSSQTVNSTTFDPQDLEDIARELGDVTFNDDFPLFPNDLCSTAITLDMLIS